VTSAIRRTAAAVAGAVLAVGLAACASPAPEATVTTLKTTGYPMVEWNPSKLFVHFLPYQAVYETLIYLDPATFEWQPLLAEEFEISDDQRTMRIKIREDVDFTDGTHLDAEGTKTALDYALTGEFHQLLLVTQYGPEVEVTGEYEIEITTTRPISPDFLFWFGLTAIGSPTAIEEDPEGLSASPVGSGPYLIKDVEPDVSITFERNPSYRDPETFPFDELEFSVMGDSIAIGNALKSGQLNLGMVDSAHAADLEREGFALHSASAGQWHLLWQDPTGRSAPEVADPKVRQAIAHAFDREAIVENLEFGYGTVTSQMFGKGSPYYVEGADDTYPYDPEKARQLLAEAGYPDGFDLVIPTYPDTAKYEPIVQQSLADIGITVTYEPFPDVVKWAEAANSGDYGLTLRGTSDLLFNTVLRIDIADGGFPELNEQYAIMDTGSKEESSAAEQRVGQIILDEAIGIALSRPSAIWASIPEITIADGIIDPPASQPPLRSIQLAG
jgi:peptide/nickel transport system substrate-binding protein